MPMPHRRPGILGRRAQHRVEQDVDPVEARLGAVLDPRGLVVVAEDPAVEVGEGDVDARGAEVGDQDVPGRRPGRRAGAAGRPPVLGPTAPSATSPRSISSRRGGRRSPGPGRCVRRARTRERDRPSRISSSTVTRPSRISSGSGWRARQTSSAGSYAPLRVVRTTFALDMSKYASVTRRVRLDAGGGDGVP